MTPSMLIASESTKDVSADAKASARDVIDEIAEILGYDITASMAEGYRLTGHEALSIAEDSFAASAETWPTD